MINLGYFFRIFTEKGIIKKISEETTKKEAYILTFINSVLLHISFFIIYLTTQEITFLWVFLVSIGISFVGIILIEVVPVLFAEGNLKVEKIENKVFKYLPVTNYYLLLSAAVYSLIALIIVYFEIKAGVELLFLFAILNYMNHKKLKEINDGVDHLIPKITYAIGLCFAYLIWFSIIFIVAISIGGLNG